MMLVPMITGVEVTFWIAAVLAILGAVGLITFRKPVYSALCLALVMISLAAIYASLGAPFLFAAQIIVYTGAVLMLFLFVVMLVGVDARDSLKETLKAHRVAVSLAALGVLALLVIAVLQSGIGMAVGTDKVNEADGGNVQGLASLIFSRYVIAFETTAALLITAAVAAMVMAHPERLRKKPGQTERAAQRLSKYAEAGVHLGADPASGVFARHNSVATPALLPDGSVASRSVSSVIADRVAIAAPEDLWAPHDEVLIAIDQAKDVEFDEELGLIDSDPGIAAHELDLFADGQSQPAIDDAVAGPPTEVTAEFETVVARPADPSSRPQTQPPDPTDLKLATSKASTTDDAPATSDAEDGYTPANTGEEEDND